MESVKDAKFIQSEIRFHNYKKNTFLLQKNFNICKKNRKKSSLVLAILSKTVICVLLYIFSIFFSIGGQEAIANVIQNNSIFKPSLLNS